MSDAVITEVVQQMESLPTDLQQQVLAYVKRLASSAQRGVSGQSLLRFVGLIPPDDLQLMRQAIDEGCEQVDWREW
jgi:hypothetical protein